MTAISSELNGHVSLFACERIVAFYCCDQVYRRRDRTLALKFLQTNAQTRFPGFLPAGGGRGGKDTGVS
jgi:hypothetical protein